MEKTLICVEVDIKVSERGWNFGIMFRGIHEDNGDALVGFCGSDYAGSVDQSGYVFTMYGAAVCWRSSLQSVVAFSTTDAEYLSLTAAVKKSFWLKRIAADFRVIKRAVAIGCDNTSAICLAKHQVYHDRSNI